MDAAAYLKKQGWRGTGHSLDHSDRGIKKPLQISKKVDALGVGIQKYGAVSDQWWMRAYDQGLKDLGTGKEGDLDKIQKHGHDRGGLYARFVKGQPIPGTIDDYITSIQARSAGRDTPDDGNAITKRASTGKVPKQSASVNDAVAGVKRRRQAKDGEHVPSCGEEDIRALVRVYVEEAIRRGIIPAKNGEKKSKSRSSRPDEANMAKVLALAGLSTAQQKQMSSRSHMVRALKRAAMQHIERATHPP